MTTARKDARTDAYSALQDIVAATPALDGVTILSAWRQDLDSKSLPAIGIATPSERHERLSQDGTEARIALVVVLKRAGGDSLEDALDDDAEALIDPLIAALIRTDRDVMLSSSATDISGAGSPRIGTLTLTFDIVYWRDRAPV